MGKRLFISPPWGMVMRKKTIKVSVTIIDMTGSSMRDKENKRKYVKKKKGDETPPVELTTERQTRVKTTDSMSLEYELLLRKNLLTMYKKTKRPAEIWRSYLARPLWGKMKLRTTANMRTTEWMISLDII